ncbi:DUF362 domain-containing protein [Candidatus Woesearchaeota archaeon]|nr:DUF362 domain-containing protein [Candidatus Woesearchaeota archaeon]
MVKTIRWKCEACDLTWIHPIETCLYCDKQVKKIIGTKHKVIGITEVHIPNPLHPIVPYNVLLLQDEHGNKMPKKTMKKYGVGDTYEDKPNDSERAISSIKIKYDFYEAVKEALELIGDIDAKGKKVLLKPNLSIPAYPYLGLSTNPKVLDALIQILKEKGAAKIAIAEQSFFVPTEKAVAKSGLAELMKKHDIEFIDIAETEFEEKKQREFTFKVSKIVDDFDLLINVPVIKTDMVLGMDGAFENLTRFLAKETFDDLAKDPQKAALALAALLNIFPKFLTIGDASIGTQGNGPAQHGEPGFYGLIFAARNPVVHDTAVQEVFCLRKLPYVQMAGKLGMGEYDYNKIEFVGNELDALRKDIKQPIGSKLLKKG